MSWKAFFSTMRMLRALLFLNSLFTHSGESYSITSSGAFLDKNFMFRKGTDRQIQPLSCISESKTESGICMFAWNCVEAGGLHLGTCIDRFYFGSCCKLPEQPFKDEASSDDEVSNEVVVDDFLLKKKTEAPKIDTTSTSTTTSTTTTTASTSTTTLTQSTTPIKISTFTIPSQVSEITPPPLIKIIPIKHFISSTKYQNKTEDKDPIMTTTIAPTTSSTSTTTYTTTTTITSTTTTTTLSSTSTSMETSSSVSAQSDEATTPFKTPSSDEEEMTLPDTTPFQVQNTSSTTSILSIDLLNEVKPSIVEPSLITDGSWTPFKPTIKVPEDAIGEAVTEEEAAEEEIILEEVPFEQLRNLSDIAEALSKMNFKEACGRRPWFQVKNRNKIYPDGFRNGPSSSPIGGGGETAKPRRRTIHRGRSHRNSKFLRTWEDPVGSVRTGRIVNGDTSDYGEWPWQISLRQWRTATYLHKCGCALLNENWAITAAHCVQNVSPDDLSLRMGEYDLNSLDEPHSYMDRKVQIVASHPKFDHKTFEYDIALLRFYEPVPFQPNIIPICIPEDDRRLVGETAWVTGWGRLYEAGPLPSVMQEVDLPVINNTRCEGMYKAAGYIEHIPNIFICAGYARGGKDSCEGDSGGPMVVQKPDGRFMLSGVISWGIGCAEKNQPGVYTRISEFRDWINQILKY